MNLWDGGWGDDGRSAKRGHIQILNQENKKKIKNKKVHNERRIETVNDFVGESRLTDRGRSTEARVPKLFICP